MTIDKSYEHSILAHHPIKFDVYSFIGIVKTYYDLPTNITDRIEYILLQLWNNHNDYFGPISYENVVLGITIFSIREHYSRYPASPPFDISDFVNAMYGETRCKENITQIYRVLLFTQDIYGKNEYVAERILPVLRY